MINGRPYWFAGGSGDSYYDVYDGSGDHVGRVPKAEPGLETDWGMQFALAAPFASLFRRALANTVVEGTTTSATEGASYELVGRGVGAVERTFKRVSNELAEILGVDRRALGKAVERIKRAAGRGGADNIEIGATGNIYDPVSKEILGNIYDEVWRFK